MKKKKRYTDRELIRLENYVHQGLTDEQIAHKLKRTKGSIGDVRRRLGLYKRNQNNKSKITKPNKREKKFKVVIYLPDGGKFENTITATKAQKIMVG